MIRMLERHTLASAILAAAFLSFQAGGARGQEEPPVEVTPIPGTVEVTPIPGTVVEATPTPTPTPTPATAVEAAGPPIPIEAGTTPGSPISTTATQAGLPGPASAVPSGISLRSKEYVPLSISLSVHGGFDDNFRTNQSAQGSWFTSPAVSLLYNLPGTATQINVHSGASFTYYPDQGSGGGGQGKRNSINAYVSSTIIHGVSERLKLEANIDAAYRTEPDISSNVGFDTNQGNFFHTLDSLAATYHWSPRFFTVTTDKFQLVDYGNSVQGSSVQGSSVQASSLNRIENTIDQELKYDLLHHGNTVVGEYRFEITDYQTSSLNSFTNFALVGLDQEFSPRLKVRIRGGATIRLFANDGSRVAPQFEGSLIYAGAHNSLLSWKTSYGTENASVAGVSSRTTFRTGLEFSYGLTARITATLDAYYHHDDNQGGAPGSSGGTSTGGSTGTTGSNSSEDAFDVFLDGRYKMNARWSFDLSVEYSGVNSNNAARAYTRFRSSAGLTYNF